MSKIVSEVLEANRSYAQSFGKKSELGLPPARGFAILTCMDARLDPAKYAGLAEGDAHVIRNAGGRATEDAIRSLIISHKLLGTNEWSSSITPNAGWSCSRTTSWPNSSKTTSRRRHSMGRNGRTRSIAEATRRDISSNGHTIKSQEASVVQDVRRVRAHPLVPRNVPIHGYIYDVKTGRLNEVAAATEAGKAAAA